MTVPGITWHVVQTHVHAEAKAQCARVSKPICRAISSKGVTPVGLNPSCPHSIRDICLSALALPSAVGARSIPPTALHGLFAMAVHLPA